MLFGEALVALEKGDYLVREGWTDESGYIVLMPKMKFLWKILTQPNPQAGVWTPDKEDYKASDWKVLDRDAVAA